jgi:hypothetical protein
VPLQSETLARSTHYGAVLHITERRQTEQAKVGQALNAAAFCAFKIL